MNRLLWLAGALLSLLAPGCGDEAPGIPPITNKGVIDMAALSAGVTVYLNADMTRGEVLVPFVEAVPTVADEAFQDAMGAAVNLVAESELTGLSADLADGVLVAGMPDDINEFTWALNETRDEATLTFFNGAYSKGNMGRLRPSIDYTAFLTIVSNPYVEDVPATSFSVAVAVD